MNNNTKYIFIIYIILITHFNLYSQDLVITIPEQFGNSSLPLPPFPVEMVKELPQENFDDLYLSNVRTIPLDYIEYNYYNDFLNRDISQKKYYEHIVNIESDFKSVGAGYSYNILSNSYKGDINIFVDPFIGNYNIVSSYSDYRFPIDFNANYELNEDLSVNIGRSLYNYQNWNFTIASNFTNIYLNGIYKLNNYFYPYLEVYYNTAGQYMGGIAAGIKPLKLGIYILDKNIYPYINFLYDFSKFSFNLQSSLNQEYIDYRAGINFNKLIYIYIGSEISNNYANLLPYIYLKESYFNGLRELKISEDYLKLNLTFIINKVTSIFSFNILDYEKYQLEAGIIYNSLYKIYNQTSYSLENKEFETGIFLEYKVSEL